MLHSSLDSKPEIDYIDARCFLALAFFRIKFLLQRLLLSFYFVNLLDLLGYATLFKEIVATLQF